MILFMTTFFIPPVHDILRFLWQALHRIKVTTVLFPLLFHFGRLVDVEVHSMIPELGLVALKSSNSVFQKVP